MLRLYTVFNVDQVEGLDHLRAGQIDTGESTVIDYQPAEEAVEASLLGMGLSLRYGGGKAFYSPARTMFRSRRRRPSSLSRSTTEPFSMNWSTPPNTSPG